MTPPATSPRAAGAFALGSVLLATVAGCAGANAGGGSADPSSGSGARTISVALTDGGCGPEPASARAGKITFDVHNDGASAVTEAELTESGRILGERENLTPGLSGSFTLRLKPGKYEVYCPGAKQDTWTFSVKPAPKPSHTGGSARLDPALAKAVKKYHDYVVDQVGHLMKSTKSFAAAVKDGDVERAKELYAPTRVYYERIEPVAETFGTLDPAIDARINDVADRSQWRGFHRLEKALWATGETDGMAPVANKLVDDVKKLRERVRDVEYQPAQLANGAVSLLDEVAKTKVTGEEERYSHTDLYDFAANVEGARKAFQLLKPALAEKDSQLAATVEQRFQELQDALKPYRKGDGFVSYTKVDQDARRSLTQKIDALAAPLSKVAAKIA